MPLFLLFAPGVADTFEGRKVIPPEKSHFPKVENSNKLTGGVFYEERLGQVIRKTGSGDRNSI